MLLENKTYSFINKQLVKYRGKFPFIRYFDILKNEIRSVGKLLSCCTEQLIAHYFMVTKQKLYFPT